MKFAPLCLISGLLVAFSNAEVIALRDIDCSAAAGDLFQQPCPDWVTARQVGRQFARKTTAVMWRRDLQICFVKDLLNSGPAQLTPNAVTFIEGN